MDASVFFEKSKGRIAPRGEVVGMIKRGVKFPPLYRAKTICTVVLSDWGIYCVW